MRFYINPIYVKNSKINYSQDFIVEMSDENLHARQLTINICINQINYCQGLSPQYTNQFMIGNNTNMNCKNQLYDEYRSEFNRLMGQQSGIYQFKIQSKIFKFHFIEHFNQLWFKIFSIGDYRVKSGIYEQINVQQAKILLDLSSDIAITQQYNFDKQIWILRDFSIGSHTSQIISSEQQLMNIVSGKTPCGQDWKNAQDEGFMQIHGRFQSMGKQNKIRINLPYGEHQDIKCNDFITLQIGAKDQQKWVVKLKQGQECKEMEQQLSTKFTGDQVHKQMAFWLRML
ncbi:hypothetical protein pb186bvf_014842 [Paramecium bursaria]